MAFHCIAFYLVVVFGGTNLSSTCNSIISFSVLHVLRNHLAQFIILTGHAFHNSIIAISHLRSAISGNNLYFYPMTWFSDALKPICKLLSISSLSYYILHKNFFIEKPSRVRRKREGKLNFYFRLMCLSTSYSFTHNFRYPSRVPDCRVRRDAIPQSSTMIPKRNAFLSRNLFNCKCTVKSEP